MGEFSAGGGADAGPESVDVPGPHLPSFLSSHQCRVCRHWSEGDWNRAPRGPAGDPVRERAEREMGRGCCDLCFGHLAEAALSWAKYHPGVDVSAFTGAECYRRSQDLIGAAFSATEAARSQRPGVN